MTKECPEGPNVSALIDGQLDKDEAALTYRHLASCEPCSDQLAREMQVAAQTDDIHSHQGRVMRLWVGGSAVLAAGALGARLAGVLGGLFGTVIGYAACRAARGRITW